MKLYQLRSISCPEPGIYEVVLASEVDSVVLRAKIVEGRGTRGVQYDDSLVFMTDIAPAREIAAAIVAFDKAVTAWSAEPRFRVV